MHPRDTQPVLENLGVVGGGASQQPAPDVAVVGGGDAVADQPLLVVDRLDDEHIRQVHAAVEGIVHYENVAGPHAVAEAGQQGLDRGGHRPEVEGDGHRLGHGPGVRAEQSGREVHGVPDDGRVGGPEDGGGHLVRRGSQGVGHYLAGHDIGVLELGPVGRLASQEEGARVMPACGPTGGQDDGGVVLVDEEWAGPPVRAEVVPARQDRRVQVAVRQGEQGGSGAIRAPGFLMVVERVLLPGQPSGTGQWSERGEADRSYLDRVVGILADAVQLLVAILETRDELRQPGHGQLRLRDGHLDVEALAPVANVGGPHPLGSPAGDARLQMGLQLGE